MNRGQTGRYELSVVAGERVRAFVPFPLPPEPPIDYGGLLQKQSAADVALGRLDGASGRLPDPELFLYSYVRKEALLSSQIEGTQSSFSDLLLFELEEAPGVPEVDVREVSSYVAALDHGIRRLRGGFPLSNRLIREVHGILLAEGRGSDKAPGEFRRSQNWIGGSRPGNAAYVPPPHAEVEECLAALEKFLHAREDGLPPLVRAGLAHVQFETIHPFLDGNGRIGRLLITLLLAEAGILKEPLLYLSLHLKENRDTYYALLDRVRREGDWEAWLDFFLDGVRATAEGAAATAVTLTTLFASDRERLERTGRRAGSALRVHEALMARPLLSLPKLAERTGLSFPAVSSAMELLVELGITRELTGRRRNRLFVYERFLAELRAGTEPL